MLQRGEQAELLVLAERIAREAARLVLAGYRAPKQVHKKGRIDLVTEFDLRSEEHVRRRLAEELPDHAVVAEESAGSDLSGGGARFVWYVDPLDGTTNFAHGHPFFCTSIALYEAGEPRVGVVMAPALNVCWAGATDLGSTRDGLPCRVSDTDALGDSLAATGFPYDRATSPDNNFAQFIAVKKLTRGVRRCGSAALDLCLTADGTYDFYWERKLKPWDLAAGAVLVRGAGGQLSDFEGGDRPDVIRGELVASNGHLHAEVLRLLREAPPVR